MERRTQVCQVLKTVSPECAAEPSLQVGTRKVVWSFTRRSDAVIGLSIRKMANERWKGRFVHGGFSTFAPRLVNA